MILVKKGFRLRIKRKCVPGLKMLMFFSIQFKFGENKIIDNNSDLRYFLTNDYNKFILIIS